MVASNKPSVYNEVVRVSHVYLGPVADRFIARQIENHLHKLPNQLVRTDLAELIDWLRLSIAMLTEDVDIIEEYVNELNKLADGPPKPQHNKKP